MSDDFLAKGPSGESLSDQPEATPGQMKVKGFFSDRHKCRLDLRAYRVVILTQMSVFLGPECP